MTSQEVVYERMTTIARDVRRTSESHLPPRTALRRRVRALLHRAA